MYDLESALGVKSSNLKGHSTHFLCLTSIWSEQLDVASVKNRVAAISCSRCVAAGSHHSYAKWNQPLGCIRNYISQRKTFLFWVLQLCAATHNLLCLLDFLDHTSFSHRTLNDSGIFSVFPSSSQVTPCKHLIRADVVPCARNSTAAKWHTAKHAQIHNAFG